MRSRESIKSGDTNIKFDLFRWLVLSHGLLIDGRMSLNECNEEDIGHLKVMSDCYQPDSHLLLLKKPHRRIPSYVSHRNWSTSRFIRKELFINRNVLGKRKEIILINNKQETSQIDEKSRTSKSGVFHNSPKDEQSFR
jgi:hypothetical protein